VAVSVDVPHRYRPGDERRRARRRGRRATQWKL